MANPLKGEVAFEVSGATFTFVLGTYAQVVLEQATGENWPTFWSRCKEWKAIDVLHLFCAGLARHHEDIPVKEMSDLMDELGPVRVSDLITDAMKLASPKAAKGGRPPKPKR